MKSTKNKQVKQNSAGRHILDRVCVYKTEGGLAFLFWNLDYAGHSQFWVDFCPV